MQAEGRRQVLAIHRGIEHQSPRRIGEAGDAPAIGRRQRLSQKLGQGLGRQCTDDIVRLEGKRLLGRPLAAELPAAGPWTHRTDAVAQTQTTALGRKHLLEGRAELLHRPVEMPKPQRVLGHGQHRGPVERRRAISRLLGIEAQLEIQKAAQALIRAAAAQEQQVRHRGGREQATGQGAGPHRPQQLAQIPEGARRQHRILGREGPIAAVQQSAEGPEAFASGELALALQTPRLGIPPELNRGFSGAELDAAAGVKGGGCGERGTEVGHQALMNAPRFKARDLGRPDIKGVGTAAKGARAAPGLAVGFQQLHLQTLSGQQGGGG